MSIDEPYGIGPAMHDLPAIRLQNARNTLALAWFGKLYDRLDEPRRRKVDDGCGLAKPLIGD